MRAKRGDLVGVAAAVAAAVLCLLTLLVPTNTAHACSCAPAGSPAEALAEADAVFAGEVTSVKFSGTSPYRLSSAALVTVEFSVSRIWKGPRLATLTVETERREVSCGFEFKKGQHYIVYVRDGRTGLCTRTAPAWRAFADVVALGRGLPPEPMAGPAPAGSGACSAAANAGDSRADVAALALLAGIVGLGIRRRPRL